MGPVWIVLADTHHARIYAQAQRGAPLVLVHEVEHPGAAMQPKDLVTDQHGRRREANPAHVPNSNQRFRVTSGAAAPHTDPDEVEDVKFAQHLARILESGRVQNSYRELVLFMNPKALGLVRGRLSKDALERIALAKNEDLLHLDEHAMAERLMRDWFVPADTFASP